MFAPDGDDNDDDDDDDDDSDDKQSKVWLVRVESVIDRVRQGSDYIGLGSEWVKVDVR